MSDTKHGWVTPRADGARARCGGPGVCATCDTEAMHEAMLTGVFGVVPKATPSWLDGGADAVEMAREDGLLAAAPSKYAGDHDGMEDDPRTRWQQPAAPPASAQPESMREGYPHDDPQFIALCREHDILGTAMQGLAAVFWRAASAQDDAKDYGLAEAQRLAQALFQRHFARDDDYASGRVKWEVLDDLPGVLSQIDNMVSGLVQPAAPAAGDAPDSLVNKLAGMAYQYAVTLDQATRDADNDELEAIARRITGKLRDDIRAALAASQQQEG